MNISGYFHEYSGNYIKLTKLILLKIGIRKFYRFFEVKGNEKNCDQGVPKFFFHK